MDTIPVKDTFYRILNLINFVIFESIQVKKLLGSAKVLYQL